VDVCGALTDSLDAGAYWRKPKQRLKQERREAVTFCHGLKLPAPDGKLRETDCANTEGIFRIIQSIPSPKAEPFKRWLAKVGYERVREIEDPELASRRTRELYKAKGFKRENLLDHMTDLELIFSMLGEAATTEIARELDARGFVENKVAAHKGGRISGNARKKLEAETGKRVVTPENYLIESEGKKRLTRKKS
jgi:hypothetical protein